MLKEFWLGRIKPMGIWQITDAAFETNKNTFSERLVPFVFHLIRLRCQSNKVHFLGRS